MATPRKTSTETNRGFCFGREKGLLAMLTGRGLAAVTTPHILNHTPIFHSWFDASERDNFGCVGDVKKLQRGSLRD
jgi:hypothetical protein